MQLNKVLSLDCTQSAVQCSSKKRALEIVSELAAKQLDTTTQCIFESLLNREKMGSTGIGQGIAIPHGRIDNQHQATAVFLRCDPPISFDAIDNKPVDLVFALLVPEDQCKQHLNTLAQVAEKLNDKQICKQLRCAQSDDELYDIMVA
ncbi:PTS IIA-like nitrogen-regulatory protein PtsN [Agarivorans sp. OAG1]|uniref:Nitrogen regulatory protein n=1 Tax=Agarivorans albus MKT 106 TaxID=1331007 RepID=R9PI98_AGAAL|nr:MULTISPECIES: PTS IIA-like nitrogen regulatory protein PtsN [Agarivorans]MPW28371.1 PTS IIA-like nitrogen regulatory protein PtsN [Agarivorans sp. B2Z047]UQN43807.1 PTS IIA-like nitrogen regulatory protein PtsN [Agarivorans sp. B2Z047]BEU04765.1 PTS IIA-like nitrogen-regulatory protein PtsN [Agarivorans sp. OAG1]GAD00973.1 PTS IIA-like nitrogen-regulatory protein PtsN [Agarivorans albus MKT 106]